MNFCTMNISSAVHFCCHTSGFISSVLDPKWLWGRGDGGGDGFAFFLLIQRISTPVAMSFCLKVQCSDGKERGPGELLLLDVSRGRNAA